MYPITVSSHYAYAGTYNRNGAPNGNGMMTGGGGIAGLGNPYGRNVYGNGNGYGYINSNNNNNNAGGAAGRSMYMLDQPAMGGNGGINNKLASDEAAAAKLARSGPGISAWGLIAIIIMVIILGMGGYYGIICYPLICKQERNYDIMDAASTTASTTTPTRTNDFEKLGNYSSRSTTPSVMLST